MDINEQDAFKLGFLTRCAEEKLTGAALNTRLEKVAEFNKRGWGESWLPGVVGRAAGGISSGVRDLGAAYFGALSLPFAASILAGGGLGYGAAKITEPRISEDEIRTKELADTYKMYADKAKSRRKAVRYRTRREQQDQASPQQSFDDVYSRV